MNRSSVFLAPRPIKWASSLVVFYCDFAVGLVFSITGPALLSFSHKYETTVDQASKILSVTLASYLVGALFAGILFKFVDRHKAAIFCLSAVAAGIATLPHVPSLIEFYVIGGVYGFGVGVFDPCQIAWIIDIWRHEAGPFILSQHFSYSIGTIVAPLLLTPFLPSDNSISDDPTLELSTNYSSNQTDTSLVIPFVVAGGVMLVGVLALIILFIVIHCTNSDQDHEELPSFTEVAVDQTQYETARRRKIYIVGLCCCFIGFYQAMEMCTMQFLPTFAHFSPVHLSETDGAKVLSALAVAFACGRASGILLIVKIPPQFLLCANALLMIVGNSLLFTLGSESVQWLWASSICLGLGFSTTYPSFYAFIEKHIFVSDTVASVVTVCGGTMAAVYPLIVGSVVETMPKILNYVDYASISVASVAFALLYYVTRSQVVLSGSLRATAPAAPARADEPREQ